MPAPSRSGERLFTIEAEVRDLASGEVWRRLEGGAAGGLHLAAIDLASRRLVEAYHREVEAAVVERRDQSSIRTETSLETPASSIVTP